MFKKWFGGGSKKDKEKVSPRGKYNSDTIDMRRVPRVASINLETDI